MKLYENGTYTIKKEGVSCMNQNEKLEIKLQKLNWLKSSPHRCLWNHDMIKKLEAEIEQLKEEIKRES